MTRAKRDSTPAIIANSNPFMFLSKLWMQMLLQLDSRTLGLRAPSRTNAAGDKIRGPNGTSGDIAAVGEGYKDQPNLSAAVTGGKPQSFRRSRYQDLWGWRQHRPRTRIILVAIVVVMMMLVMLAGMFTVPFPPTLVVPVNPVVMIVIAGHPDPLESVLPIPRAVVIRPIANID